MKTLRIFALVCYTITLTIPCIIIIRYILRLLLILV